jgi:hypothetical protein
LDTQYGFPEPRERPGHVLSRAFHVGDAMTYKIVTENGTIIQRSVMRSVEEQDEINKRISHDTLDCLIGTKEPLQFDDYIPYIRKHSCSDGKQSKIEEEPDSKRIKMSENDVFYQEDETTFHDPVPEDVLGMKVIYERNGIPMSATVKEILADNENQFIYKIQYESDGRMEIRDYEDLMQHLMKINKEGETYWSFDEILDHKRCNQKKFWGMAITN